MALGDCAILEIYNIVAERFSYSNMANATPCAPGCLPGVTANM